MKLSSFYFIYFLKMLFIQKYSYVTLEGREVGIGRYIFCKHFIYIYSTEDSHARKAPACED